MADSVIFPLVHKDDEKWGKLLLFSHLRPGIVPLEVTAYPLLLSFVRLCPYMKKTLLSLATLGMLGIAADASASTIWTLDNVALHCSNCAAGQDSNTVTGSFTVDTALATVTAWDVTVSGTFSGVDYEYSSALNPNNSSIFTFNSVSTVVFNDLQSPFNPYLELEFASPLSNAVPTNVLLVAGNAGFGSSTFTCGPPNSLCGVLSTAGSLDGTSADNRSQSTVPEPATLSLLGLGLAFGARKLRSIKK